MRATPEQVAVLRRAAEVIHKSLTGFILDSTDLAASRRCWSAPVSPGP
ncbi:DUF1778 domain-containing protein [Vulcanococcus limneticus]